MDLLNNILGFLQMVTMILVLIGTMLVAQLEWRPVLPSESVQYFLLDISGINIQCLTKFELSKVKSLVFRLKSFPSISALT